MDEREETSMATTDIPGPAMDLVAAIVGQSVADLASTTDRIIAGKDAEIARLRAALGDILDAIEAVPEYTRPVSLDRLISRFGYLTELTGSPGPHRLLAYWSTTTGSDVDGRTDTDDVHDPS